MLIGNQRSNMPHFSTIKSIYKQLGICIIYSPWTGEAESYNTSMRNLLEVALLKINCYLKIFTRCLGGLQREGNIAKRVWKRDRKSSNSLWSLQRTRDLSICNGLTSLQNHPFQAICSEKNKQINTINNTLKLNGSVQRKLWSVAFDQLLHRLILGTLLLIIIFWLDISA